MCIWSRLQVFSVRPELETSTVAEMQLLASGNGNHLYSKAAVSEFPTTGESKKLPEHLILKTLSYLDQRDLLRAAAFLFPHMLLLLPHWIFFFSFEKPAIVDSVDVVCSLFAEVRWQWVALTAVDWRALIPSL